MKRAITRADVIPVADYAKMRRDHRRKMIETKKQRRLEVGPHACFYFESYDTMWLQVHEMLYIERGGDDQIEDELRAYNPLIPQKGELVATLMFEIDDPGVRARVLRQLTAIEETAFVDIGGERVKASFETDVDRTAEDGKTSSVHFLKFALSPVQVARFRDAATTVMVGFTHANYGHIAVIQPTSRAELGKDLA